MRTKLLFLLFFTSLSSFAQYTRIPDLNFENKLIALGIDSGTVDGQVLTSKIASVTTLDVQNSFISDLTGIQGFSALTYLTCTSNQLTSLDITKNTALTHLDFRDNQLTSLDVSNNKALLALDCRNNQLTSLDVSKNTALGVLNCFMNKLTSLDVSKNTALIYLVCSYNQ